MFKVKKSLLPEASEWGDTCSWTHQDTRCLVVFGKLEWWCTKVMQQMKKTFKYQKIFLNSHRQMFKYTDIFQEMHTADHSSIFSIHTWLAPILICKLMEMMTHFYFNMQHQGFIWPSIKTWYLPSDKTRHHLPLLYPVEPWRTHSMVDRSRSIWKAWLPSKHFTCFSSLHLPPTLNAQTPCEEEWS